jgi:hypothetical protein
MLKKMGEINIAYLTIASGFIGAVLGGTIPMLFETRQYWYFEKKEIINSVINIQIKFRELSMDPQNTNSQLFVTSIEQEILLVKNCSDRFYFHRIKLEKVIKLLKEIKDLVLEFEFEKLLNIEGNKHKEYTKYSSKIKGLTNSCNKKILNNRGLIRGCSSI